MMETYKKRIGAVCVTALLIIGLMQLFRGSAGDTGLRGIRTPEDRLAWLSAQGWVVQADTVSEQVITLPRDFPPVLVDYNLLQRRQGFDLSRYAGKEVTVYTYRVENYPNAGEVWCCLYQRGSRIIGGDVHSSALGGFMVGLLPTKNGWQQMLPAIFGYG